jgi:CheY-like chemotaxis protein
MDMVSVTNQDGLAKLVLIAEDDDEIREVLEELLSGAGYRPITAEDGLEALDWLSWLPVDLIIVDLLMPHLDGPELIKRVRQTSQWAAIPILVLSAYANLDRYRNLPVDGIQLKPFHLSDLLEKVQQLIGPSGT